VDPRRRQELTRYGVPAAFLAAATIAILLVKAGLDDGSASAPRTVAATTTSPATTQPTTTISLTDSGTTTTVAAGRYHTIESGDTLGSIALEYDTTVEELVRLNPDVDPTALRPGDRIRVG
jgi:LysM repeat protein